jgi:iron complex outermembrane recepter protein
MHIGYVVEKCFGVRSASGKKHKGIDVRDNTMFRVTVVLACLLLVGIRAADSQTNPSPASQGLEEIVVTGSRIPQVPGETIVGVTVITSEELEARGFKNAFDALNNLPQNTGFTQGADYGNTFTPAANTISLRGLGPNHTLVLIDGMRVTDYPLAYNGAVNFVNLANIPSAAIDRIEVLNGGASAIYGSDAIAGVVNIILKHHADGLDVNLKAGGTERDGGNNYRAQITGGGTFFDKLDTVFAFEASRVQPISAEQRDFMSSTTLQGAAPYAVWSRLSLPSNNFVTPPNNCAGFTGLFNNSTAPYNGGSGTYCGSGKVLPTYWTMQTGDESENLYGRAKYELTGSTQLFTELLVSWNHTWNNTRGPTWTSDEATTQYFYNETSGSYEQWNRAFSPEEIGGVEAYDQYFNDVSAIANTGVQGDIGSSTWKYEAAYNASVYSDYNKAPSLLSNVDSYFLGPQLGTDSNGIPIYAPNTARFNQPLTPAEFSTINGAVVNRNVSWMQNVNLSAHGELGQLPGGPVGMAAVLEWGNQGFSNTPDPGINRGVFYDAPVADESSGSRSHEAGAVEFKLPILDRLLVRLASRYDEYSFAGRNEGKPTYNAGLEFKPIDSLRLHGSYATSFRAPDMNYIFQAKSQGYFSETTDYYLCALSKQPLSTCPYTNYSPGANYTQYGSSNLGFESGRSFDYGAVFTPSPHFQLSADYWNIRINNEVTLVDTDLLLRIDSACLLGTLNPKSEQCIETEGEVQRNPPTAILNPNAITNINIYPINASFERTDGMDFGMVLKWGFDSVGTFVWTTNFTMVMSHYFQQYPGNAPIDLIHTFDNPNGEDDFPNKLTSTLAWSLNSWSATLEVDRYGSIVNSGETGFLTPTSLANASVQYKLGNATFGVIVNNLLNTIKRDNSAGWPFYPVGYYFPYGREGWVEFSYHFGKK